MKKLTFITLFFSMILFSPELVAQEGVNSSTVSTVVSDVQTSNVISNSSVEVNSSVANESSTQVKPKGKGFKGQPLWVKIAIIVGICAVGTALMYTGIFTVSAG